MSYVLTDNVVKALRDWNFESDFRLIWKLRKSYESGKWSPDEGFSLDDMTQEEYRRISVRDLLLIDDDEYWKNFEDSYTVKELEEIEKFSKEARKFTHNLDNFEKCEVCPFNRNRNEENQKLLPCGDPLCLI